MEHERESIIVAIGLGSDPAVYCCIHDGLRRRSCLAYWLASQSYSALDCQANQSACQYPDRFAYSNLAACIANSHSGHPHH